MRRNVSGMDGLVGLWGCDEGQGSALTDWTDNHACCLGRGGTEWVHVPRGVPVAPVKGHGRWELLAAVGLRPDFESDDQRLPEGGEEEAEDEEADAEGPEEKEAAVLPAEEGVPPEAATAETEEVAGGTAAEPAAEEAGSVAAEPGTS